MKKFYILFTWLFCFYTGNTQGVYQFWGVTKEGGSDNLGTIFSMNTSGNNFQTRHSIQYSNPGVRPVHTELVEYNGKFYGMTSMGGSNNYGVIFEWDPVTNAHTKKFDFGGSMGVSPYGSLTLSGGKFYGMTAEGGSGNYGVIFEWDPETNVYTKKFDFSNTSGTRPNGSLVPYAGKLYGMTSLGGSNYGVIFEWDPATNVYTKKYSFNNTDGGRPQGNLTESGGKFYGLARSGGANGIGVIFEWDPSTNVYTKKFDFSNTNGAYPYGRLTPIAGKFYGLTQIGGNNNYGVIFEWDPATNVYTKKIDLNGTNGSYPYGSLAATGGKLYGMTNAGGSSSQGVVFEWDPVTNVYTKKIDFNGTNGGSPSGSLTFSGGKLYGMTGNGGTSGKGVIFEWEPATNVYTKKIDFNGSSNGSVPVGHLALNNGKLYGITQQGGSNGTGVIFEWDPVTESYSQKIDFTWPGGANSVSASLVERGGKFYGMTREGGSSSRGVIFEWDPSTNTYTKKFDFNGTNGRYPSGSLTLYNDKFYGITQYGGSNDAGVIFEWDPVTNIYTTKINLNYASGGGPYGSSLVLNNGKFYSMTFSGGSNSLGVIFEWDPVTNVYTKKIDLNINDGASPVGNLTFNNGKFYGTTQLGGASGYGVIFEWDPASNVYTKKLDFNYTNGTYPNGTMQLSGGKFYGNTEQGGTNGRGVVFEWDPATNIYTKKIDFTGANGQYPYLGSQFTLVPALVAKGSPGNCVSLPAITIDNSNNNTWVAITDEAGDVVAEINANGNNLGLVSASMYINDGPVREDHKNRLYLDRNLTITPQVQPSTPVDLRLYIRDNEYQALKNAANSEGQSSGVASVNDLGIFKNDNDCEPIVNGMAQPVSTTVSNYDYGHVLTASINSFSSFYFANNTYSSLPLTWLDFSGRLIDNGAALSWKTENEINTFEFIVERSADGSSFHPIGKVAAGTHQYHFTDNIIHSMGAPLIYYRLKQIDLDGRYAYSKIIALRTGNNKQAVLLYPNPVVHTATLAITTSQPEKVQANIMDNTGRVIKQLQWNLPAGTSVLPLDVNKLAKGMYFLELKGATINYKKQLVKQ